MVILGKMLNVVRRPRRNVADTRVVQRANRAALADRLPAEERLSGLAADTGGGWARPEYGRYMATSPSVYAAIKLRADAMTRPPLRVYRTGEAGGRRTAVEPSHPVTRLLDRVNPWHTRADLWRATETHLCLWGAAFWAIERDEDGQPELWPLRPDRVAVIPDRQRYVRGFVYRGVAEPVAYTPDEIVWLRYFNPLEELAGLSPLAPARLSADMGHEGLRFNRHLLRNSARPDFLLLTNEEMNESELEEFYARWEMRYQGSANANRPAVASQVRDVKTLGLSHRDIDFIQGLRWSLEEVSRAYGVPKLLLGDFERATYANVQASERMFWRNTVVPEVKFLEEQLNRMLLPRLGYPQLSVEFDLSAIEALQEDENNRVQRGRRCWIAACSPSTRCAANATCRRCRGATGRPLQHDNRTLSGSRQILLSTGVTTRVCPVCQCWVEYPPGRPDNASRHRFPANLTSGAIVPARERWPGSDG